jgi:hypothetical protein
MQACSKALAVLSGDDAHDLFTKTFNPALVQEERITHSDRRSKASKVLSTAAHKLSSPRLATLATQVRLDAFTRVKKAIDDMIAQLLVEKADEIKHKDFCVDEFNTNQLQTEKKEREKQDLTAKIEDLEMAIEQLTKAIETLKAEIAEMQVQLKRAGEDREKENKEFQTTVADQRETQKLLQTALGVLQEFYGKKAAAFVQKQEPAGPPPPPGFEAYKKSAASGGVMGMIQQIINDAKAMEAETIRSEEDAQKAYEDFVKETNASIEAKSKDIVSKSEVKAKKEGDLVEAREEKESVMVELEQLSNYNAELHSSCDFVMKNFDLRQTARDEEVEALRQAKAILSGAKFEEFLQEDSEQPRPYLGQHLKTEGNDFPGYRNAWDDCGGVGASDTMRMRTIAAKIKGWAKPRLFVRNAAQDAGKLDASGTKAGPGDNTVYPAAGVFQAATSGLRKADSVLRR